MADTRPRYEFRVWGDSFPDLPAPGDAPWQDETYVLALGLLSVNVKLRDEALEIKELLADQSDLQLWSAAARLTFPIPALTLERELMVRLQIGEPLHRERYGPAELLDDIVAARQNLVAVPLRKRRHLFEFAGCRAETAEVMVAGRRVVTAAFEHEAPEPVRDAIARTGLTGRANLAYPAALELLVPPEAPKQS